MATMTTIVRAQYLGAFILFALLLLSSLLSQTISEAQLAGTKYIFHREPSFDIIAKLVGGSRQAVDSASSETDEDTTADSSSRAIGIGYLNNDSPRLALEDQDKLVEYIRQQLQQQQQQQQDKTEESNEIPSAVDLNSHLLPSRPDQIDATISGPVNEPEEFEAAIGSLTNTINHELPNSSARSEAADNLMNMYIELQKQRLQNHHQSMQDNDGSKSNEMHSKNAGDTTPASRYGGGEYIDHPLALIGHQYVQGGAGEGKQLLGPDGTFENIQVVKTDHTVPSYCDPPNPCPAGYTAEDGCLEKFVNSASFSREYQARQQCSCDNEHSLFNCASPVSTLKNQIAYSSPAPPTSTGSGDDNTDDDAGNLRPEFNLIFTGPANNDADVMNTDLNVDQATLAAAESKLDTLARTIQNRFGNLATIRNLISKHNDKMEVRGY